jgi:hypothetical protein
VLRTVPIRAVRHTEIPTAPSGMPVNRGTLKRMASDVYVPARRLPFRRTTPPHGDVTARDLAIVARVARYRFLTSEQIARADGGSHQQVLRRLRFLFDLALLDRPRAQLVQVTPVLEDGTKPMVYGLARGGARLLAETGVLPDERLDWTTKNRRATPLFLAHTIETAEVMLAFEQALAAHDDRRIIDHHELLPLMPEATQAAADPFRCRVTVQLPIRPEPLTIGVVPDRLFSIAFDDQTRLNFALELDRGTMDIRSRQLIGKSSFRRKLIGYWHLWQQRRHAETWGFQSFRVLTVTPSEKRLNNMLAVQREVVGGTGSNLFLFTTPERLNTHGPLGPAWVSGKGEAVALLS